jgi:hypothetical protein
MARKELERDLNIPDYTEIVGDTVGHLMSIVAETAMTRLSTCIFLSHARQKTERYSVGEQPPQADRRRADDYVRRIGDQIEMTQYIIRSRIGEDRDTVLDMGRIPDYETKKWMPSGLSKGKERAPGDASAQAAEPAPKRAGITFTTLAPPLTPDGKGASESGATKCNRGYSDTPDDERRGPPSVMDISGYSPVSGVEQEPREFKTEDQAELMHMARGLPRRSHVINRRRSRAGVLDTAHPIEERLRRRRWKQEAMTEEHHQQGDTVL